MTTEETPTIEDIDIEDIDSEDTTKETTTETTDEYTDDGAEPEGITPVVTPKKEEKKEEEDIFPDDKEKINKQVTDVLSPHIDRLQRQATNTELKNILLEHPEYKPYEARIKRFVDHPARRSLIAQGLPVNTVVIEAISPYLQTIGAKRKTDADTKARQETVNATITTPTEPAKIDVNSMTLEEVNKMAQKIQSGQFKAK